MSNTSNNYAPINSGVDGTALAHTLVGTQVGEVARANGAGEGIVQAVQFSTAPYRDKPRTDPRKGRCAAKDDTCKGWAGESGYCSGHARGLGLIENWNKKGRSAEGSDS